MLLYQVKKNLAVSWGSRSQWFACLLLDPAAPGYIPNSPEIFSEEKNLSKLLRLINGVLKRKWKVA